MDGGKKSPNNIKNVYLLHEPTVCPFYEPEESLLELAMGIKRVFLSNIIL